MAYYSASIDDNDPNFIYSANWQLVTVDGDWRGTMHSTDKPGAYARVRFTGSRVVGVFTIPTGDNVMVSAATFSIDDGPPVFRSRVTTPPVQWNYILFDSGPLPYGNHLLVITYAGQYGYLRIDRIDYDPTDHSAPATPALPSLPASKTATTTVPALVTTVVVTSNPASSTAISTTKVSSGTPTSSTHSKPSVTDQSLSSTSNTSSVVAPSSTGVNDLIAGASTTNITSASTSKSSGPSAALIGGILGGLLVLLLMLLAGFFLLRRRRKSAKASANANPPEPPSNTVPTPFDLNMRSVSSMPLVSSVHRDGSATDYSSPTGDSFASESNYHPAPAFDSNMMASAKYAEHLQSQATSTAGSSGYPPRLSVYTEYAPPPAYH